MQIVNAVKGSHNRVEAAVCLYARMVDKENLWVVLYALKVGSLLDAAAATESQHCLARAAHGCNAT